MSRLTILNAQVLMDKDLTLTDLRVYGAICMFANTHSSICFPKQQTIADRLGINVPMVSKSVGVLVEKGYILKGAKVGADGRKKQNYYTIKYDIILQENELMPEHNSGVDELMPQDNCELMPQDKSLYNTNSFNLITPLTKKNKTKKENSTISSFENVQPTVKESLTVESVEVEVIEKTKRFQKPTIDEILKYANDLCKKENMKLMNLTVEMQNFFDFYEERDWKVGKTKMKEWKFAVNRWVRGNAVKEQAKQQNLSGQKLIQKPVFEVSEEDKEKQDEELKEYAKIETKEPEFIRDFKASLKSYFGRVHDCWIEYLKIQSVNETEIVFILQKQSHLDTIERNKEKFETIFKREFQGFKTKEFTGSVKYIAWKKT